MSGIYFNINFLWLSDDQEAVPYANSEIHAFAHLLYILVYVDSVKMYL